MNIPPHGRSRVMVCLRTTMTIGVAVCALWTRPAEARQSVSFSATRVNILAINTAINAYEIKTGMLPISVQDLLSPLGDGEPLLSKKSLLDGWKKQMRITFWETGTKSDPLVPTASLTPTTT